MLKSKGEILDVLKEATGAVTALRKGAKRRQTARGISPESEPAQSLDLPAQDRASQQQPRQPRFPLAE